MARWGVDISRYQPAWSGSYDDQDFIWINVDDPGLAAKIAEAIAHGKGWGVYIWVYPYPDRRANLHAYVREALAKVQRAGFGSAPIVWLDYEEAGVIDDQIEDGLSELEAHGYDRREDCGYYSNAHTVDHRRFANARFWLAAYPGGNTGAFPGVGALRGVPRNFDAWQFSSSNGTLDRNYSDDDDWIDRLRTGVAAPSVTAPPKRKRVPEMWMAVIKDIGWVDLWSPDGTMLASMANDYSFDANIFSQVRNWLDMGYGMVPYNNEAEYAPVRANLLAKQDAAKMVVAEGKAAAA